MGVVVDVGVGSKVHSSVVGSTIDAINVWLRRYGNYEATRELLKQGAMYEKMMQNERNAKGQTSAQPDDADAVGKSAPESNGATV